MSKIVAVGMETRSPEARLKVGILACTRTAGLARTLGEDSKIDSATNNADLLHSIVMMDTRCFLRL